jgi:hypothetical protein
MSRTVPGSNRSHLPDRDQTPSPPPVSSRPESPSTVQRKEFRTRFVNEVTRTKTVFEMRLNIFIASLDRRLDDIELQLDNIEMQKRASVEKLRNFSDPSSLILTQQSIPQEEFSKK